jgi:hypothetical protein
MTLDPIPTNEFWEEWVTRLLAACPPMTELIIFWCINKDTVHSQLEYSNLLVDLPEEFLQAMSGGPNMCISHFDVKDYHFLLRLIVGDVDSRAIAASTNFVDCPLTCLSGDYILRTPHPRLHKGDWDVADDISAGPDFWTIGEDIIERRRRATCL